MLKLCKSPGAESTVEKKKQIGRSSFVMKLYFTFIPVPREKQLDRMWGQETGVARSDFWLTILFNLK